MNGLNQYKKNAYDYIYSTMTVSELKKLYTQQRDIAEKRRKRLEANDLERWSGVDQPFAKIRDLNTNNKRDIAYALADVQQFLSKESSKVRYARQLAENTAAKFREMDYNFVNAKNVGRVLDLLESLKGKLGKKLYDSDTAVQELEGMPDELMQRISEEDFQQLYEGFVTVDQLEEKYGISG